MRRVLPLLTIIRLCRCRQTTKQRVYWFTRFPPTIYIASFSCSFFILPPLPTSTTDFPGQRHELHPSPQGGDIRAFDRLEVEPQIQRVLIEGYHYYVCHLYTHGQ